MKKQLISLSMFMMLVFAASSLFAQDPRRVDVETKLTANGKSWVWYASDPKATVDKDQTFTFSKTNHKVSIKTGSSTVTKTWSVTSPNDGPATLVIGTDSYTLTFGSDTAHPEFMILKGGKVVTSNYYYSLPTR